MGGYRSHTTTPTADGTAVETLVPITAEMTRVVYNTTTYYVVCDWTNEGRRVTQLKIGYKSSSTGHSHQPSSSSMQNPPSKASFTSTSTSTAAKLFKNRRKWRARLLFLSIHRHMDPTTGPDPRRNRCLGDLETMLPSRERRTW